MIPDLFSEAERTFVEQAVPGLLGRCCFRFLRTANTPPDQKLRGIVRLAEAFVRTRAEWVFSLGTAPFKAFFQGNPWTPQPRPNHGRISPSGELIDAFILTFQSQKVFLGFVPGQETPDPEVLNLGIWYGFPDLARYCLDQGTLPNERSLRAAMDENNDDLFDRILALVQTITDLGQLSYSRHFQRFRTRLVSHAGKTGKSGEVAATLLARELAQGKIPTSCSGDVNALTQDGCTPLESLIGLSYEPALEKSIAWLLSHGADPNIRSPIFRQTPLARSLSFPSGGYARISALLIKAGAQVDERDKDGGS